MFIPRAACSETFSRYANGVRVINGSPAFSPTPLALGLNVETSHSWPREVYIVFEPVGGKQRFLTPLFSPAVLFQGEAAAASVAEISAPIDGFKNNSERLFTARRTLGG